MKYGAEFFSIYAELMMIKAIEDGGNELFKETKFADGQRMIAQTEKRLGTLIDVEQNWKFILHEDYCKEDQVAKLKFLV